MFIFVGSSTQMVLHLHTSWWCPDTMALYQTNGIITEFALPYVWATQVSYNIILSRLLMRQFNTSKHHTNINKLIWRVSYKLFYRCKFYKVEILHSTTLHVGTIFVLSFHALGNKILIYVTSSIITSEWIS